jgi:acyl-CoA hydrolase
MHSEDMLGKSATQMEQGKHAPGGKYDFVINGHMIGGFAVVAWPEEWGN